MIPTLPTPNLESQFLTEKKLAWVLDLSESALRHKRSLENPPIPFFKDGQQITRYDPQIIAAYICANTIGRLGPEAMQWVAVGPFGPGGPLSSSENARAVAMFWQQISRLIQTQVQAAVEREEVAA